ncbi:hypothetical protein DFQ28_004245, partial [Apophysomyces sp. BC1034]
TVIALQWNTYVANIVSLRKSVKPDSTVQQDMFVRSVTSVDSLCNKCRTTKSVGEFHKHQHVCKECYNSARRVKKAGVVEQITAPTTASEMVNVAKEHIVPTKGFGNYITALNAERYDEGFVRSSVVTFVEAMNVPQQYAHLKAATVPRNYYDYICAFYSKHKEQYDLEYPIVPEERLVTSIKYY